MTGTLRPEAALIRASMLPDLFCLHVAAHKALLAQQRGKLTTRSLHSELVFNLSGSKHVSGSNVGSKGCREASLR